jgi:hypothetical protein
LVAQPVASRYTDYAIPALHMYISISIKLSMEIIIFINIVPRGNLKRVQEPNAESTVAQMAFIAAVILGDAQECVRYNFLQIRSSYSQCLGNV